MGQSAATLEEIVLYPVKSLAGVSVATAQVEPWGLKHDRRWVLLRPDGTVLNARREHRLLGLTAVPQESGAVRLLAPDGAAIHVDVPTIGEQVPIALSRLDKVRLADSLANEWLSTYLGQDVRLAWLDDPRRRTVSLTHGGRPDEPLNLSDAGPLLLTTTASLRQLNEWLGEAITRDSEQPVNEISMRRFRPNIVISGPIAPFIEDTWKTVQIGGVELRLAEHCDRCVMTTIDPDTLQTGKQPLRTLARHRKWSHKTWFGVRLIPTKIGSISIHDGVATDGG